MFPLMVRIALFISQENLVCICGILGMEKRQRSIKAVGADLVIFLSFPIVTKPFALGQFTFCMQLDGAMKEISVIMLLPKVSTKFILF